MRTFHLVIVGGGIGGAAAALRAGQHGLDLCWVRGDASTARASRAKYVVNVDNMIGVHEGTGRKRILEALSAPEYAAARAAISAAHFHVGTQDIVENVEERLRHEFADAVTIVDEKAHSARRDEAAFTIGTSVPGLFALGDMTRRRGDAPSLKQIYTAQEYAVRAVQAIDRRVRAARRKEILA